MKNVTISKVGVGSLGRLFGYANAIIALIVGLLASIVTTVSVIANNNYNLFQDVFITIAILVGYVIILPLLAFALAWLYGAVVALVLNVFLGAAEGLDIEVIERK
jgi:hypothetical protein